MEEALDLSSDRLLNNNDNKYLWILQMELSVLKINYGLTEEMEFHVLRTLTMICICAIRGRLQLKKSIL